MRSKHWLTMGPLNLSSFHLAAKLLAVAGCSKSKRMLTVQLSGIKEDWLPKAIHSVQALTSLKPLRLLPNGLHYVLSWHWLPLRIFILRVWTSHLHFSMENLRKKSICANHQDLKKKVQIGSGAC